MSSKEKLFSEQETSKNDVKRLSEYAIRLGIVKAENLEVKGEIKK